jgi:hypothetical protein
MIKSSGTSGIGGFKPTSNIKPTNGFQESIGNQGFQHAVKTKSKNWLFRIWYKLIGK